MRHRGACCRRSIGCISTRSIRSSRDVRFGVFRTPSPAHSRLWTPFLSSRLRQSWAVFSLNCQHRQRFPFRAAILSWTGPPASFAEVRSYFVGLVIAAVAMLASVTSDHQTGDRHIGGIGKGSACTGLDTALAFSTKFLLLVPC